MVLQSEVFVLCGQLRRRVSCNGVEQEGGSKLWRLTNDSSARRREMLARDHECHYWEEVLKL